METSSDALAGCRTALQKAWNPVVVTSWPGAWRAADCSSTPAMDYVVSATRCQAACNAAPHHAACTDSRAGAKGRGSGGQGHPKIARSCVHSQHMAWSPGKPWGCTSTVQLLLWSPWKSSTATWTGAAGKFSLAAKKRTWRDRPQTTPSPPPILETDWPYMVVVSVHPLLPMVVILPPICPPPTCTPHMHTFQQQPDTQEVQQQVQHMVSLSLRGVSLAR